MHRLTCGLAVMVLILSGCARVATYVSASGDKDEVGAHVFINGKPFGVLYPKAWDGPLMIASSGIRGAWGDVAVGDTIVAPGDTIAVSVSHFLHSGWDSGPVEILAISREGDSLKGHGELGGSSVIQISFARRRIFVSSD